MIDRSRARRSEAVAGPTSERASGILSIGGTRRFTRTCQPCLQRTYVMLFTSRALLSARFTIFYVTWMDLRFFRIGPDAGHVAEVRARAAAIIAGRYLV